MYAIDMATRAWAAIGRATVAPADVIAVHIQLAMDGVAFEAKMETSATKKCCCHPGRDAGMRDMNLDNCTCSRETLLKLLEKALERR
jgi:hypothetical protein